MIDEWKENDAIIKHDSLTQIGSRLEVSTEKKISLDLHVEQGYLPITFTFYEVAKKVQAFKQPLGK